MGWERVDAVVFGKNPCVFRFNSAIHVGRIFPSSCCIFSERRVVFRIKWNRVSVGGRMCVLFQEELFLHKHHHTSFTLRIKKNDKEVRGAHAA